MKQRRDGMINRITAIGNLEEDPEIWTTRSGKLMVRMDLEVMIPGRPRKSYETWQVVVFGRAAGFAETLEAGDKVYVEGFARLHADRGFEVRAGQVVGL